MEALTGSRAADLQDELGPLAYRNPEGGEWETADRYLSGNVRAPSLSSRKPPSGNSTRLPDETSKPCAGSADDLEPGEIEARLGSSWIPPSDIRDFVAELLDVAPASVKIGHAEAIATWTVELDYAAKYVVSNTTTHGTARFRASDLIEQSLNGRTPTAYDEDAEGNRTVNQPETIAAREKQQQLKDRFRDWVWEDRERAERLAQDYNFRFNNIRLRDFDGSHLTLPGMVRTSLRDGDLAPHQKKRSLAHPPGRQPAAGACRGRRQDLDDDRRRDGTPPPGSGQEADVRRAESSGRAMGRGVSEALPAGATCSSPGRITSRPATASRRWRGSPPATMTPSSSRTDPSSSFRSRTSTSTASSRSRWRNSTPRSAWRRIERRQPPHREGTGKSQEAPRRSGSRSAPTASRKTSTLTFEELGVDQLFVDEADLYKNLAYITKMNRIAGLPNSDSNRAFDMFLKTRYLQERSDGRGVVFATGTPISNTMAEMYTMLRYLAPEMLAERKVEHFDAWAANFAEAVTSLELAPDGSGYRMHTRFAKFINLPELLSMFRTVADVQTADMLNLPRPALESGRPAIVAAPASPELQGVHPDADRTRRDG